MYLILISVLTVFALKWCFEIIKRPSFNVADFIFVFVGLCILFTILTIDDPHIRKDRKIINYYSKNLTQEQRSAVIDICRQYYFKSQKLECQKQQTLIMNRLNIEKVRHGKYHRNHYYLNGVELFND